MKNKVWIRFVSVGAASLVLGSALNVMAAPLEPKDRLQTVGLFSVIPFSLEARAWALPAMLLEGWNPAAGFLAPEYFAAAFSGEDEGSAQADELRQEISEAVRETDSASAMPEPNVKGMDTYEIAVVEYFEEGEALPRTKLYGYVQIDTENIPGQGYPLFEADGVTPIRFPGTDIQVRTVEAKPRSVSPLIAKNERPLQIRFWNLLPAGAKADLFIPASAALEEIPLGASLPDQESSVDKAMDPFSDNRTVWIHDRSSLSWVTPAVENRAYPQGSSARKIHSVAEERAMGAPSSTLYYTGERNSRLLFYYDPAFGITRTYIHVDEAAPKTGAENAENALDIMKAEASLNPLAPSKLKLKTSGEGTKSKVSLTWVDNSLNETGFLVQRALSESGPWTALALLPANSSAYDDFIGTIAPTYFYKVFAYRNLVLNPSDSSEAAAATTVMARSYDSNIVGTGTASGKKPKAPSQLQSTAQRGPAVSLTFTDNAVNESGFIIKRSVNGGVLTPMATIASLDGTGQISFLDQRVRAGDSYRYTVSAINAAGESSDAEAVTLELPKLPELPSAVRTTVAKSGKSKVNVTLTWEDQSQGEASFTIEQSADPSFSDPDLVSVLVPNGTEYTTGELSANKDYYFRIRANSWVGSSPWVSVEPFPITAP